MIVSNIEELRLVTILERGVANKECISIRVNQYTRLGQFGIMIGRYSENGTFPFTDNLFWFGHNQVKPDDWIFIYTGSGPPRQSKDKGSDIYTVFWGKQNKTFAENQIVSLLF